MDMCFAEIIFLSPAQFLAKGSLRDIQLDDVEDFQEMDRAMTHMGMSDAEKMSIYVIVAGVLHLGNVGFEDDDNSSKGRIFIQYF